MKPERLVNRHIGYAVAIGEKEVIVADHFSNLSHSRASHCVETSVNDGHFCLTPTREGERDGLGSARGRCAKKLANLAAQVTEAEHEVTVSIERVVLHDVHDDGLRSDWDHRFGHRVVDSTDARALTTAQDDDLHD